MGMNRGPKGRRPLSSSICDSDKGRKKVRPPEPWAIKCGVHKKQMALKVSSDCSPIHLYYCPLCHLELANKYGETKNFPKKNGLDRVDKNSMWSRSTCYLVKPRWWRDWLRRTPRLLIKDN